MDELWINPSTMLTIANNTRNGLKEYINSNYIEKEIDENYENLKIELSTIDAELKAIVENAKDSKSNREKQIFFIDRLLVGRISRLKEGKFQEETDSF